MRINIKYLLILGCFIAVLPVNATDMELRRGLYFQSFEVDKDKRTCLDLTPDEALVFDNGFTMAFDVNLRLWAQSFGYVFRIICNDTLNIDLLSDITSSNTFSVVAGNQALLKYKAQEIDFRANTWITVSFRINPVDNEISIALNGVEKTAAYPLNKLNEFEIYFGGNAHTIFSSTDIAPMTVKDIRISDENAKLVRHWELGRHAQEIVYDKCVSAKAVAYHAKWEIDNHVGWRQKTTFILPDEHYQITFDQAKNRIFFVKNNKIWIYDMEKNTTDAIETAKGIPLNTESNQILYDSFKNELITYDFDNNLLVRFDFQSREWNNDDNRILRLSHWHHSRVFLANEGLIVTFGGYGFHKYSSILHEYKSGTEWIPYDLSAVIAPRYLGCMGYLGDRKLLYFGGFGNASGKQE
ncbi:MAG: hypothetical protein LBN71_09170, partial [Tannerella sp.]|nr:hypothetical protein [Tannerella sp.]